MKPAIFIIFALFSLASVSQENETCVICFGILEGNIFWTPCRHSFHQHCIEQWLEERTSCPTCRHPLRELAAEQNPEEGVQLLVQMQQGEERMRQNVENNLQVMRQNMQQIMQQNIDVTRQGIRQIFLQERQRIQQRMQQNIEDTLQGIRQNLRMQQNL